MGRLAVTLSSTGPTIERVRSHLAVSARVIMVGPETVPLGHESSSPAARSSATTAGPNPQTSKPTGIAWEKTFATVP